MFFGESMRGGGRAISIFVMMVAVAAGGYGLGQEASPAIPAHKAAIVLFGGADLKNFRSGQVLRGMTTREAKA
jgi:hypothetical protein